jgi:hypothetical protein
VSTDDKHGEADKEISLEFLGLNSCLAFAGDSKMVSGLEGNEVRCGDGLVAKQLDPISKITLLFLD